MNVDEAQLAGRDLRVDRGLGSPAAVAGAAQVVVAGLLALVVPPGKRVSTSRCEHRELVSGAGVAGAALEAVGRLGHLDGDAVLDEEAEAALAAVAARAGGVDAASSSSQWRAASLEPSKWPRSPRTAADHVDLHR